MPDTLAQWLECHDLSGFLPIFQREQISVADLPHLTEAHLKELGLPLGPRTRFLAAVTNAGAAGAFVNSGSGLQIERAIALLATVVTPGQSVEVNMLRGRIADVFAPTGLAQEQRGLILLLQSGLPDPVAQGRPAGSLDLARWVDRLCSDHCLDRSKAMDLVSIWNRVLGGNVMTVAAIAQVNSANPVRGDANYAPVASSASVVNTHDTLMTPQAIRPPWAAAVGKDRYGTWADLRIGPFQQRMRLIPAGSFQMGSRSGDRDETPVHQVILNNPFWLGEHQVAQNQWRSITGNNPSEFIGEPSRPVERVSWDDCHGFIKKLNGLVKYLHAGFPTEAQWEYACRAGTSGDFAGDCQAMTWYSDNSRKTTHPVKMKMPNAFGLYDMHGNVWEWCSDWYGSYPTGMTADPLGPVSGSARVIRGGGWGSEARDCRSASRLRDNPGGRDSNLGFRLLVQVV